MANFASHQQSFNCPSCGGAVKFQSQQSVFAVCVYCRSSLVRHDVDVEAIGKMAELQDDLSPVQIGSSGVFQNKTFSVIGRIRQKWDEGFWNEWCALFTDGRTGWLAEAQGFWMVSFETSSVGLPQVRSAFQVGGGVELAGTHFEINDIKDISCAFSEGELPFAAPLGRQSVSIDLIAPKDRFASLDLSAEGVLAYVGAYQEFSDFKFQNTRKIDGW
jgi:hypothetical protein